MRLRRDGLPLTVLLLVTFVFWAGALQLEEDSLLLGFDVYFLFRPLGRFAFEAFRQGSLPLWNPTLFLGFPHYAEPQLSTFYPLFWLAAWVPEPAAFNFLYCLHFGIAATGGYALVRRLGGRPSGALLAGFVLAFGSFMILHVRAGHLPHLMTIVYMGWLLAGAHWAVEKRSWAATAVAGVPLGLAMLAGYAPFFPFLVAGVSVWMGWLAWQRGREKWRAGVFVLGQWVGLGAFAGLLAAVQLLPTAELTLLSSRVAGADYEFASSLSMPYWNLVTLLMPDIYGVPDGTPGYWAPIPFFAAWEFALYAGVLPFILFCFAWKMEGRGRRFWGFLALGGLLIALGPEGALHRVLYQFVPGFGLFRVPARLGYFYLVGAAVITGLTFDAWFERPRPVFEALSRKLLRWGLPALGGLLVLALLWQAAQADSDQVEQVGGVVSQLVRFGILVTLALGLLLRGQAWPVWARTAAALALLMFDLWGSGYKHMVVESADPDPGWIMADIALPPERDRYRVMSDGLPENQGAPLGFQHVNGYDDFRTHTSLALHEMAEKDARVARLLGVRYFLDADLVRPPSVPGWELMTQPAGVNIYAREDAQPRAFMVHAVLGAADAEESLRLMQRPELDFTRTAVVQMLPGTQCAVEPADPAADEVRVTSYRPERVVVEADAAAGGWLVLSDLYYPGWQATVSGEPAVIQPTNYGLRGVCVPAGEHQVVFEFRPPLLVYGALGTFGALGVLGIALLVLWRGSRPAAGRAGDEVQDV